MSLHLDETGLPVVPGLSREDIRHGFKLFFLNQHKAAERFFDKHKDSVVLFSMGKSAVLWLWALLSLEPKDIEAAIEQLNETHAQATSLLKTLRPRSWFRAAETTNDTLHCEVIIAQCILLTATLQFISGTLLDKVKGGINMRMVVGKYAQLEKDSAVRKPSPGTAQDGDDKDDDEDDEDAGDVALTGSCDGIGDHDGDGTTRGATVDDWVMPQTRSMIHFGLGVFNLVTSILPPRLRKVASIFGFPCNRAKGLRLLRRSFLADSIISPIAALVLLVHHCILQASFDDSNYKYKKDAQELLDIASDRYPDAGLFHMMRGRYCKLTRELKAAITCFNRSMEVQHEWKPLADMGLYEEGFIYMFLFDMETALGYWEKLLETNDWSKVFYAYMCGVCATYTGQTALANRYFSRVTAAPVRQLHGQQLTVDRFATRKVKQYVSEREIQLIVPHLEVIFVWGGFNQMPRAQLERARREVMEASCTGVEQRAVACLLRGALELQLGNLKDAEHLLTQVEDIKTRIKHEVWTIPYARFELAKVWRSTDGTTTRRVADRLQKSFYKSEHNFDVRLHFRVHLAQYQHKHAEELELEEHGADEVTGGKPSRVESRHSPVVFPGIDDGAVEGVVVERVRADTLEKGEAEGIDNGRGDGGVGGRKQDRLVEVVEEVEVVEVEAQEHELSTVKMGGEESKTKRLQQEAEGEGERQESGYDGVRGGNQKQGRQGQQHQQQQEKGKEQEQEQEQEEDVVVSLFSRLLSSAVGSATPRTAV